ncbi:MAG: glycosyltransferase [Anaerolineae bacterium]
MLLRLLDGLPRDKITAVVVCPTAGPLADEVQRRDIRAIIVPIPKLRPINWRLGEKPILNPFAVAANLFSTLIAAFRVTSRLRDEQIALLQTNSTFSHIYGGLAAKLLGLPCVWYPHEHTNVRRRINTISWRLLCALLATRVVAISEAVLRPFSAGPRGRVIYAGQPEIGNSKRTLRSLLGLPEHARIVGYIGRVTYGKGVDVLARAARQVVESAPQVHFVLIGGGWWEETPYKAKIAQTISESQLSAHWHWIDYDPQAATYIPEMELLVLPSRHEPLGLVLLEAGQAARPVVASRVGGIPEVVLDGETGILVTPGDPDELAAAILHLINNPPLAQEMGRKGHERVKRVFGLQRYYTEFLELYEDILGCPKNSLRP